MEIDDDQAMNQKKKAQGEKRMNISKESLRCKLEIDCRMVEQVMEFNFFGVNITNTFKYHVFAPMGRFQLELIYLYFPSNSCCFCPEVTLTPTRPVDNVVITTKGL